MIAFAICAAGLTIVAVGMLLRPLLRNYASRDAAGTERSAGVAIYRERLADLQRQTSDGVLDEGELTQAKTELQRELLRDSTREAEGWGDPDWPDGPDRPDRAHRDRFGVTTAIAIALLIPAVSLTLYAHLGRFDSLSEDTAPTQSPGTAGLEAPASGTQPTPEQLAVVVEGLATKLKEAPDDGEGWLLLARSYVALDRHREALTAFSYARQRLGDNPNLLVEHAEALAVVNGNRFTEIARAKLERAIAIDPGHQRALWLAGFAALQQRRPDDARVRWQTLLRLQPPESAQARTLRGVMDKAFGADASDRSAGSVGSAESGGSGPPSVESVKAPAAGLDVDVVLDPDLAVDLDGSEDVFVFARALDGPPMPLAAVRLKVKDLPTRVRLDDATAMIATRRLSDHPRVVVGARISRHGGPIARSGDLQGLTAPLATRTTTPVTVVIAEVVP